MKHNINEQIRANKVWVIWHDWTYLWEMYRDDAIEQAYSVNLDLVEMWEKNWLVTAKIMDYGKFLFDQSKKQKQHVKKVDTKTIQLTYKMWPHDVEIRKNQVFKFHNEWHNIKITMRLKWREKAHEQLAFDKIEEFINDISSIYSKIWNISIAGWNISISLKPIK